MSQKERPEPDPEFHREVYRELGDQVRNINNLRNTYRSVAVVGAAAVLGFAVERDAIGWVAWATVGMIAGIGFVFTLITNEYIRKPLRRQRQIMVAVWSPWWLDNLGIASTRSTAVWKHRLDWFDVVVFAGVAVASAVFTIFDLI